MCVIAAACNAQATILKDFEPSSCTRWPVPEIRVYASWHNIKTKMVVNVSMKALVPRRFFRGPEIFFSSRGQPFTF